MNNGEYYYSRHRNRWGVWKRNQLSSGICMDEHVGDFSDKEEARCEVYRLNGWKIG